MDWTFAEREASSAALGGWQWARFSSYEITDDIVHPAKGATCELYDPWQDYRAFWARRRRSEKPGSPGTKRRNARRQHPYQELLRLAADLEFWPDDPRGGRVRGEVRVTPGLRNRVKHWCKHNGLLGVLQHRVRELCLPPVWQTYPGRQDQLHAVTHQWKLAGTSWQHVVKHLPGVVEKDLSKEGRPVPTARLVATSSGDASRLRAGADRPPRPLLDLIDPTGGLISESELPEEGLLLERFDDHEWQRHFPTRPEWHTPTWPFPNLHSTEFLQYYGEPLEDIIHSAERLRGALDLIHYYRPKHTSPTHLQRRRMDAALDDLTAISRAVVQVAEVDAEGRPHVVMDAPSLLATYASMIMLDLAGGTPVQVCRRCKTPFVHSDRRAGYCSDRCRWAAEKAEYRGRSRERPV